MKKSFTYFLGKIFISILIFYSNYINYFNLKINLITYELTNDNIIKAINITNTFLDINTKLLAKIIGLNTIPLIDIIHININQAIMLLLNIFSIF